MTRRPASAHDYRLAARSVLPKTLFEYVDGGSLDEGTLSRNVSDFDRVFIRQRALVGGEVDLASTLMGRQASFPVALAPIGSLGMLYPRGELVAFRAAHAAGISACLSSFSICSIEDVAPEVQPGDAFQLYPLKDSGWTDDIIGRARHGGFDTLIVTVDTTHPGMRDRDLRNGYRSVVRPPLSMMLDVATHPGWLLRSLPALARGLGNYHKLPGVGRGLLAQAAFMAGQLKTDLTWSDIAALAKRWQGRLVVKGITDAEDAARAVDAGAAAVVVSNHGGRQLDGGLSSLAALPRVVERIGASTEVIFDSGIRRGSHLFKAIALGANGCLLGRSYAFALASGGEKGVTALIEMLRKELRMTMVLAGAKSVAEISKDTCLEDGGRTL